MTDLTPNHPAVEAATPDIHSISLREYTPEDCHETIADALNAALPHLTADDLRDTPAVADLIAERDTYREFAFEVDGLQRALEDGELDLRHCDTRLVPTEDVMDWLGQLIKRVRSGLIHQEDDA